MEYENHTMQKDNPGKEMPMGHETIDVPMSMTGGHAKPGEELIFKVEAVKGDMVTLSYATPHAEEESPDMSKMSKDDMHKMPLDKMEKALPHADREDM